MRSRSSRWPGRFAFTLLGPGTELDYAFSGMFVADPMANVLKLMLYVTVAMVMVYSRGYLRDARHASAASSSCWRCSRRWA